MELAGVIARGLRHWNLLKSCSRDKRGALLGLLIKGVDLRTTLAKRVVNRAFGLWPFKSKSTSDGLLLTVSQLLTSFVLL